MPDKPTPTQSDTPLSEWLIAFSQLSYLKPVDSSILRDMASLQRVQESSLTAERAARQALEVAWQQMREERQTFSDAAVAARLEAERQRDEAQLGCVKAAAQITFIAGQDIPETIERARAALVLRCESAERALAEARRDAVEECAKVCEHLMAGAFDVDNACLTCAAAIRALSRGERDAG